MVKSLESCFVEFNQRQIQKQRRKARRRELGCVLCFIVFLAILGAAVVYTTLHIENHYLLTTGK